MTDRVRLDDRFVAFHTSTSSVVVDGDASAGVLRVVAGCTTGGTDYTTPGVGCLQVRVDASSGLTSVTTASVEAARVRLATYLVAPQFNTLSDARLKEHVEPLSGAVALSTLAALEPVTYTWLDGRSTVARGHPEVGFLAQQVEAAGLPQVVTVSPEGEYGVAYARLTPLLVAGLQELTATVRATASTTAALRAELATDRAALATATARLSALLASAR